MPGSGAWGPRRRPGAGRSSGAGRAPGLQGPEQPQAAGAGRALEGTHLPLPPTSRQGCPTVNLPEAQGGASHRGKGQGGEGGAGREGQMAKTQHSPAHTTRTEKTKRF